MKIAVIATLDTKGPEAGLVRDTILGLGATPVVIDPGTLGEPGIPADITREQVAEAGGEALCGLLATNHKAHAQAVMTKGLVALVTRLYAAGELQGVVALGGAQGTAMATAAMQALPVGVPKVMVSTVACGKTPFGPYVGTRDITMIHSVADISGLNQVTRRVLAQGAAAAVAMARVGPVEAVSPQRPVVAVTQTGITTPGVMAVKARLEALGFDVLAFHGNGIGGKAMEELVAEGVVSGVIDFSPHEITDLVCQGEMPALPGRMTAAGAAGIPQIVVPGCTDIIVHYVGGDMPAERKSRVTVKHTATHLHVRVSPAEMAQVAHYVAEHLNAGHGPRASIVPLRGFSMLNRPGGVLYDEDANRAYVETLRRELAPGVCQVEVDAHINDPEFADRVIDTFMQLREEGQA